MGALRDNIGYVVVLITCGSWKEAQKISKVLVKDHLAACVNAMRPVQSIYTWKGHQETASETLLIVKTKIKLLNLKKQMKMLGKFL